MSQQKPAALTDYDWDMILRLDKSAKEAMDSEDIKRVSMLYSKIRYPMSALAEYENRYWSER